MQFKEWLIQQEIEMDEAWSDYNPFKSKPFNPSRRNFLKAGALGAGALALSTMKGQDHINWEPLPPMEEVDETIIAFNKVFGKHLEKNNVSISRKDVKYVKPSEVLRSGWGQDFDSISQSVRKAQDTQKIDDIEVPNLLDDSIPQMEKIDIPVMVVFLNPTVFGHSSDIKGFQTDVFTKSFGKKPVVVVSPNYKENTLRHELRHAMQNSVAGIVDTFEADSSELEQYLLNYPELGVRLAELRMQYYQKTKILANDNLKQVASMIQHFLKNIESYPKDVQQLQKVINLMIKKNKLKEFFDFVVKNMPMYVRKYDKKSNDYGNFMA
jgi:hypothetical protein